MIINKNISDKTFFLLTNYNDPNLFQFHLPFLNLMPYALKNVSPVHNFIKKRVTSSIVDMVMVANCYKLSLVRVLNVQSVPSKSGVFLYIFKKLVLTPWTNFFEGDRGFIVENVHILYMYMYIYTISFVLAEKSPSFPYRLQ